MKRIYFTIALILSANLLQAQQPVTVVNTPNVVCTSGCSAGTSDVDDGSIATGQTGSLGVNLNYTYDGSVWRRITFGVSGTPSAQVSTTQGITGMVPFNVVGRLNDILTVQSGATGNGNGSLINSGEGSGIVLTINCAACAGGTTINFEGTNDVTNYTPLMGYQVGVLAPSYTSTVTTAGVTYWMVSTVGFPLFRARISAYSAGTIDVTGSRSTFSFAIPPTQPVSGTVTANAGTNLNTSLLALESGGNLASIKTDLDPALSSTAGLYVRQDYSGTISKERDGFLEGVYLTLLSMQKQLSNLPTRNRLSNALPVSITTAPPNSLDPCSYSKKGNTSISQTAISKLASGISGQVISICYARIVAGAAEILNLIEGTGSNCGTGTLAVTGSTTAGNGESYAANGGFSAGNGSAAVAVTKIPGNDLCLSQSGSNRLSGNVTYVYGAP